MAAKRVAAACGALEAKRAARIALAKAQGRRPHDWVAGKKSTYDPRWAQAYCEAISLGASGYELARDPAMPTPKAVYRWLRRFAEFRAMYARAREGQQRGLMFQADLTMDVIELDPNARSWAKAEVARIEGRKGRIGAKVWG